MRHLLPTRTDAERAWRMARYWTTVAWNHVPPNRGRSIWILGHPRTGTNWLCRVLGHYFAYRIDGAESDSVPVLSPVILHLHRFATVPHRTVYTLRDGRDVMLSYYFKSAASLPTRNPRVWRQAQGFCPKPFTAEHVRENLPGFIRFLGEANRSSSLPYAEHVRRARRLGLFTVRYEDMLRDAESQVARAVRHLGAEPDADRVKESLEETSFERRTGRKRGVEDPSGVARKGIAGDWRNHFTREAAEALDRYAGDVLIESGYAANHSWVDEVPAR